MLRDAAITIIKRGLGFLSSTTHDDAIVDVLKEAQAAREGARSLPWFLLQEDQTIALTEGTRAYALPTGFLREDIDFNPVSVEDADDELSILGPLGYDEAMALYAQDKEGIPEVYCIRASTLEIFPLPDADYTFKWSYYKADTVLDTNIENLWLEHVPYVLIADAGFKMAMDLRDEAATAIFQRRKNEWDDWYNRRMTEKLEANVRYIVGKYA